MIFCYGLNPHSDDALVGELLFERISKLNNCFLQRSNVDGFIVTFFIGADAFKLLSFVLPFVIDFTL